MGYHEMIVHVPMLACPNPRRVLIVGGGDGGSLQQVLRYPSVEEAVVCELDQRVVEVSRQHFTAFGDPWADPRARLVIRMPSPSGRKPPRKFDANISDTPPTSRHGSGRFIEESTL
jgi:spermidine synthase